MKYYVDTLQAIFTGINRSVPEAEKVPLPVLLQHIYTYAYIKSHLIEQPLAAYSFLTKDAALKAVHTQLASTITDYTTRYLQRNQTTLVALLRDCFAINWTAYRTLQPLRTQVAFFLTSLALVGGDLSLYVGTRWVCGDEVRSSPKKHLAALVDASLITLREVLQALRDISEQGYCQVSEGRASET